MKIEFEVGPVTKSMWAALPKHLHDMGPHEVAKRVFQTYVRDQAVMD